MEDLIIQYNEQVFASIVGVLASWLYGKTFSDFLVAKVGETWKKRIRFVLAVLIAGLAGLGVHCIDWYQSGTFSVSEVFININAVFLTSQAWYNLVASKKKQL